MPHAVDRMDALIARWGDDDRRSLFVSAYRSMSLSMLEAIEERRFQDNEWVGRLLDRFAEYYFDAVDDYERGNGSCPAVWNVAFDQAGDPEAHPLRVLFLGINAHINYDLALSLADVMQDWPEAEEACRLYRKDDYELVDRVIRETVDSVQTCIVEPAAPRMGTLDRMLGPLDEWLFSKLIAGWRHDSWDDAVRILEADPLAVPDLERRALKTADRVIHIGPG